MSYCFMAARRTRAVAASVVALAAVALGLAGPTPTGAATPLYYVAMGDSLGAGVGASPGSNAYVNQIYQHELAQFPGLVLQNFSCSGATTGSVINGPNCGSGATQLAQATAFLSAHAGQVAFLTIDIGANDVDGCATGTTINMTCVTNGLNAVGTNLPQILAALKSSYPGLGLYGMNYYDPFLAAWLTGPSGQTLAQESVALAGSFNGILTDAYTPPASRPPMSRRRSRPTTSRSPACTTARRSPRTSRTSATGRTCARRRTYTRTTRDTR